MGRVCIRHSVHHLFDHEIAESRQDQLVMGLDGIGRRGRRVADRPVSAGVMTGNKKMRASPAFFILANY